MQIKNVLIGIAIIILTFLVVLAGIQTFYPQPDYQEFCGSYDRYPMQVIIDKNESEVVCTMDAKECPDGTFVGRDPLNNCEFLPCSNDFQNCWQEYDNARANYARNLFIIALVISIILLGVGATILKLEPVGSGIMGGGIITLIYGASSYWPRAENLFRFIIALAGLAIVIGFAYWINNQTNQGKSKKKRR